MDIIRKELTTNELYPANLRYDDVTGVVQFTPDGGTTWIDSPQSDPRNNSGVPAGDGSRCDAAARMVALMKDTVDLTAARISQGYTAVGIAGALGVLWALVGFFAALVFGAIVVVVGALVAIGATTLLAAMTTTVYDQLRCILYKYLSTDGQLTAGTLAQVRSEVNSVIGGTAATIINYLFDMLGFGGLNNAAAMRSETGDCSTCDEWCIDLDFVTGNQGFAAQKPNSAYTTAAGSYSAGVGWIESLTIDGSGARSDAVFAFRTFNATLTHVEMHYKRHQGQYTIAGRAAAFYYNGTANDRGATLAQLNQPGEQGDDLIYAWDGSQAVTALSFAIQSSYRSAATPSPRGDGTIVRAILRGTGTKPSFGADCVP